MHTKVMVNRGFRKNGSIDRRMIVWATFRLGIDAHIFADKLRKDNSTWIVVSSTSIQKMKDADEKLRDYA